MVPESIQKVALVGGCHGNELTGIYLVKKFDRFPELLHRHSFNCETLIANPSAVAANRRYIDRDLNRCFGNEDLNELELTNYENVRAKEIATQLGSTDRSNNNVIIDLHSTTSNMGLTILPSSRHPFNMRLGAYLSTLHPDVRIVCGIECSQNEPMLRSLSPLGCTIEVGAVPQGVLNADLFQKTEMLVHAILDYIDAHNLGKSLPVAPNLTYYQSISSIDYPRNSAGEIQAMVHPQLQYQDYRALRSGDPLFLTFTGDSILYQGEETVFPIFINEAAYIEKGIAMTFTTKQQLLVEPA
jgi:succinylglutamate desuccinylase